MEVLYDEFTEDIDPNRLLKSALSRLERMSFRDPQHKRKLRLFRNTLEGVGAVEYPPHQLPTVIYNRLNEHYRPSVELAKLVLRSCAVELGHGKTLSTSFLVDMNEIFENFVVVALRETLGLSERDFPQNARGRSLHLDRHTRVSLEPDISWWAGSKCVFVGDVKYKRVNVQGIKHADLYQLLAYTIATDLPTGLLIYAAGEGEPAEHEVVHVGKTLQVLSLDLSGDPEDLLGQIRHHSRRVLECAAHASLAAS